jgi:hypothetical protein
MHERKHGRKKRRRKKRKIYFPFQASCQWRSVIVDVAEDWVETSRGDGGGFETSYMILRLLCDPFGNVLAACLCALEHHRHLSLHSKSVQVSVLDTLGKSESVELLFSEDKN